MQELLLFMYSGRVQNLAHMALDLLAAADRFQLPGLKEMADQVLRLNLGTDSVCRILVFADMHNARELKQDAIRFIAQNSSQVIQVCCTVKNVQIVSIVLYRLTITNVYFRLKDGQKWSNRIHR
jgi:hypothetical protein